MTGAISRTAHAGSRGMRTIRSFVIRAGRVTAAQQRALIEQWPQYGVEFSDRTLNLAALFGNTGPCTMEIGFGNGAYLVGRAQAEPERNFLGVEVHRPGIGSLLRVAAAAGLGNVRVIAHDAVEVLGQQITPAALDEVHILFPDPWPKKRHHKRRLIQAEFALLVASRLRQGGRLMLATDWEPYAEQMRLILNACPLLDQVDGPGLVPATEAPTTRASTRFERRGLRLGLQVQELNYRRTR